MLINVGKYWLMSVNVGSCRFRRWTIFLNVRMH